MSFCAAGRAGQATAVADRQGGNSRLWVIDKIDATASGFTADAGINGTNSPSHCGSTAMARTYNTRDGDVVDRIAYALWRTITGHPACGITPTRGLLHAAPYCLWAWRSPCLMCSAQQTNARSGPVGLNIAPAFRVVANSQDITDKIMSRFKSLRITDETDNNSDMLELQLADHDPSDPIQLPPVGAELEAFIGYDGDVRRMGLYICDEVEISGYPGSMTRARAPRRSKPAKAARTICKHRRRAPGRRARPSVAWCSAHGRRARNGRSRERIAGVDHAAADSAIAGIGHEPAAALAKQHDAIAKPGGGRLMFIKRGESTSASGERIPDTT